jgi:hypothetical protein
VFGEGLLLSTNAQPLTFKSWRVTFFWGEEWVILTLVWTFIPDSCRRPDVSIEDFVILFLDSTREVSSLVIIFQKNYVFPTILLKYVKKFLFLTKEGRQSSSYCNHKTNRVPRTFGTKCLLHGTNTFSFFCLVIERNRLTHLIISMHASLWQSPTFCRN